MAIGDINFFETSDDKVAGSLTYAVASGSVESILPGEPVQKLAGTNYVTAAQTSFPTTTLRQVGIATSKSTETMSDDGIVRVSPATMGQLYIMKPNDPTAWDTQAEYNALVGSSVLMDLTTGSYTILASDGSGNGCIVEYLDIATYPGQVAFSFSLRTDYRHY